MKTSRTVPALAVATVVLLLAGCGGGSSNNKSAGGSSTTQAASAGATAGGGTDGLDVCSWYTTDDAAAVLGKPVPKAVAGKAQGSLLGKCDFSTGEGSAISISARPADEYQGSVDAVDGTKVANLGSGAAFSDSGLLVQPAGKDYFIQIIAMPEPGKFGDEAMHVTVAKTVLANL